MTGPLQTGFQGLVNNQPAPAVAGDFYGANPRASILVGEGKLVAPPSGLIVGNFAFVDANQNVTQGFPGSPALVGFLRRSMGEAIITDFLSPATMLIKGNYPITLFSEGDFWAKFAGGATPGQTVYADPTTGAAIAAASGGLTTASVTASAGFTGTGLAGCTAATATSTLASAAITAVTGFIAPGDTLTDGTNSAVVLSQASGPTGGAGTYNLVAAPTPGAWVAATLTGESNTLDVTAVATGKLEIGSVIAGSGVTAATITAQQSGTTGGIGLYTISGGQQKFASTNTLTATDDVLTVTAVGSGALNVGNTISGAGVTSGTEILSQLTGSPGGIGTYQLSAKQSFASTTVTVGAIATGWIVNSVAAAGELAMISTWG
jgi:hypothetical protein